MKNSTFAKLLTGTTAAPSRKSSQAEGQRFVEQLTGTPRSGAATGSTGAGLDRLLREAEAAERKFARDTALVKKWLREKYDIQKVEREGAKRRRKMMAKHKGKPLDGNRRKGAVAGMAESVRLSESCTIASRGMCRCKRCVG